MTPTPFLFTQRLACGALAALLVAGCATNPVTGRQQLSFFGTAEEIALGEESDQEVVAELGTYPDAALESYVAELGRRLAASSERPELPWTFRVVDDPTVNAFALPGGYIYVTRGILTHLGSEAELAAVLGHEIGHVTARHGVHQLSQQLLALAGLGIGLLLLPEDLQEVGEVAAVGVALLFLKYSRDDERQADDLGLRYLAAAGYDPRAMPEVFTLLQRLGDEAGGGALPAWLSTHPNPENRRQRIAQAAAPLAVEAATARLGEEEYLRRIDGVAFGDDPRRGFLRDGDLLLPEWRLRLRAPAGWELATGRREVNLLSPGEDALLQLAIAEEASVAEAATTFFAQQGVTGGREEWLDLGELRVLRRGLEAAEEGLTGFAAFLEHDGRTLRLLAVATPESWPGHQAALVSGLERLSPLAEREARGARPHRLEIVELPRAMTLEEFADAYPSVVPLATLALLNRTEPATRLAAGHRVKRVVDDSR